MAMTQYRRIGILLALALVLAATRQHHYWHHFDALPDASWAVFFLGGLWLRGSARWTFPLLMVEAVLVDYLVIHAQGIDFWSHYCVSAAYWFLLPSYAALWLGGAWLARRVAVLRWSALGPTAAALLVSVSVCYLISNGSFYWLSDSVPRPRSLGAWAANLADWYLPFLTTTTLYVAVGAILHAVASMLAGTLGHAAERDRARRH